MERYTYGQTSLLLAQTQATRSLLKFCVDHGSTSSFVDDIRACLAALELGEKSNAIAAFNRVRMGPHGFDDWFPPAVAPSEDGEYAFVVFDSLVERWTRLMNLL